MVRSSSAIVRPASAAALQRPRNAFLDASFARGMAVGMDDYEHSIALVKRQLFDELLSGLVAGSSGDVLQLLELGIGTGPNLPYYTHIRCGSKKELAALTDVNAYDEATAHLLYNAGLFTLQLVAEAPRDAVYQALCDAPTPRNMAPEMVADRRQRLARDIQAAAAAHVEGPLRGLRGSQEKGQGGCRHGSSNKRKQKAGGTRGKVQRPAAKPVKSRSGTAADGDPNGAAEAAGVPGERHKRRLDADQQQQQQQGDSGGAPASKRPRLERSPQHAAAAAERGRHPPTLPAPEQREEEEEQAEMEENWQHQPSTSSGGKISSGGSPGKSGATNCDCGDGDDATSGDTTPHPTLQLVTTPQEGQPLLWLAQRALEPLQRLLADNCHLSRDPLPAIQAAFEGGSGGSVAARRFNVGEIDSLIAPHVAGLARRGSGGSGVGSLQA